MSRHLSRPVHLVGSVPLASAKDVFECVGTRLGAHIARIPDGETGERRKPFPMRDGLVGIMDRATGIVYKRDWKIAETTLRLYGLAPDISPTSIEFGPLGFARAAIDSYEDFKRVRNAGKISPDSRMQVSIPTPFMMELIFIAPESLVDLLPAFEQAMLNELSEIAAAIPGEDLALQWDIAPEFMVLERCVPEVANVISRQMLMEAVARVTDAVPVAVEVGWHFCYGDTGKYDDDRETHHVIEPSDMGIMVAFANDLCLLVRRSVNWVHMPVPRERDDEGYFSPLQNLKLKPDMDLFLGLVHKYDGLEGAKRRIAAARMFYPSFGIATECGMGRRPPELIPALLDLHREIAQIL